jgi:hypothetical protein
VAFQALAALVMATAHRRRPALRKEGRDRNESSTRVS